MCKCINACLFKFHTVSHSLWSLVTHTSGPWLCHFYICHFYFVIISRRKAVRDPPCLVNFFILRKKMNLLCFWLRSQNKGSNVKIPRIQNRLPERSESSEISESWNMRKWQWDTKSNSSYIIPQQSWGATITSTCNHRPGAASHRHFVPIPQQTHAEETDAQGHPRIQTSPSVLFWWSQQNPHDSTFKVSTCSHSPHSSSLAKQTRGRGAKAYSWTMKHG